MKNGYTIMSEARFPDDFSNYTIGENYPVLKTETSTANQSAALSLINQARRHIDLFTYNLDPRIFDNAEIVNALKQFIKISPNSRFRVLITDPSYIIKHGHHFIELARQFSSFIELRQTHEEYRTTLFNFLIVDEKALLYRPHRTEYYGIVNYNAKFESKQQRIFFNTVWERSEPISDLKQLFI